MRFLLVDYRPVDQCGFPDIYSVPGVHMPVSRGRIACMNALLDQTLKDAETLILRVSTFRMDVMLRNGMACIYGRFFFSREDICFECSPVFSVFLLRYLAVFHMRSVSFTS